MFSELSFRKGRELRNDLAAIVCSGSWLDTVVPQNENGVVRGFFDDVFPPGGDTTIMRACHTCKRISPPNGCLGICCDCEVEQAEFAYLERLRCMSPYRLVASIASEREQVWRRWWRMPIRFAVTPTVETEQKEAEPSLLVNNPFNVVGGVEPYRRSGQEGESSEECPSFDDHAGDAPRGSDQLPNVKRMDRHLAGEIACRVLGTPSPLTHCFDPIPRSSLASLPGVVATEVLRLAESFDRQLSRSVRDATTAFRKACRSLGEFRILRRFGSILLACGGNYYCLLRYEPAIPTRNVSVGSGRSAGCALQLLTETETGLQREIDYARKHGVVAPSTKRFTRRNPYRFAPEDYFGLLAFYGFRMTLEEREEWRAEVRAKQRRKRAKAKSRKNAKKAARKHKTMTAGRAELVAVG